jgi:hypothetical protein
MRANGGLVRLLQWGAMGTEWELARLSLNTSHVYCVSTAEPWGGRRREPDGSRAHRRIAGQNCDELYALDQALGARCVPTSPFAAPDS